MFDEASSIDATCPMASVQSLHLEGNLVRERFLSAVASGIFDRGGHPSFEPLIFSTNTTSELGMVSTQNPTGRKVSMPQLCGEMHPRGKLDGWLGSPSHGTYVSRDGKKWGIPSTFDRFWGVHWIRQQDLGRTLPPRIRTIEQGSQRVGFMIQPLAHQHLVPRQHVGKGRERMKPGMFLLSSNMLRDEGWRTQYW